VITARLRVDGAMILSSTATGGDRERAERRSARAPWQRLAARSSGDGAVATVAASSFCARVGVERKSAGRGVSGEGGLGLCGRSVRARVAPSCRPASDQRRS